MATSRVRSVGPDLDAQGTLPAYLTRFVGRSSELGELTDRLEQGNRLITICGAGGLGKTRLAIELMHRMQPP